MEPCTETIERELYRRGFATLGVDLVPKEAPRAPTELHESCWDLALLCHHLDIVMGWAAHNPIVRRLPIGLVGCLSAGAAVSIVASRRNEFLRAIVMCSGTLEGALPFLQFVHAPMMLIVGARDGALIESTRTASRALRVTNRLEIVHGADRWFEEPGRANVVATLAADWLAGFLRNTPHGSSILTFS
jgi:dienelactone hydrolase